MKLDLFSTFNMYIALFNSDDFTWRCKGHSIAFFEYHIDISQVWQTIDLFFEVLVKNIGIFCHHMWNIITCSLINLSKAVFQNMNFLSSFKVNFKYLNFRCFNVFSNILKYHFNDQKHFKSKHQLNYHNVERFENMDTIS